MASCALERDGIRRGIEIAHTCIRSAARLVRRHQISANSPSNNAAPPLSLVASPQTALPPVTSLLQTMTTAPANMLQLADDVFLSEMHRRTALMYESGRLRTDGERLMTEVRPGYLKLCVSSNTFSGPSQRATLDAQVTSLQNQLQARERNLKAAKRDVTLHKDALQKLQLENQALESLRAGLNAATAEVCRLLCARRAG